MPTAACGEMSWRGAAVVVPPSYDRVGAGQKLTAAQDGLDETEQEKAERVGELMAEVEHERCVAWALLEALVACRNPLLVTVAGDVTKGVVERLCEMQKTCKRYSGQSGCGRRASEEP